MKKEAQNMWISDQVNRNFVCRHGVKRRIISMRTDYQQVDIVETENYGICLFLDGKMQSSEADEFIYHEALVHPAMLAHPDPRRVLIVGGGEGATLREVLRHKSVEYVVMADIDELLVQACQIHLTSFHQGSFDDPRVKLIIGDAREYLERTENCFDVIIIDISEPVEEGPAYLLYTKEFYQIVYNRLTEHGVISMQAGSTAVGSLECMTAVCQTLNIVFPDVAPYEVSIPSFGLPWGFIVASKEPSNLGYLSTGDIDDEIHLRIQSPELLRYYNEETHIGQFALPKHIRRALENETRIIEDGKPLFVHN